MLAAGSVFIEIDFLIVYAILIMFMHTYNKFSILVKKKQVAKNS